MRLDAYLAETGAFPSRARAHAAIKAGLVQIDGECATRPSQRITEGMSVEVLGDVHPFVSRGGVKLEAALDSFAIDPGGLTCLDLGASTGGFTDVLLSRGAAKVYAVDVGHGQLHETLRVDDRVINLEGVHANQLGNQHVTEAIDLLVCDVSFISLEKVLPSVFRFCREEAILVALFKPQFEVGRGNIGKGGIVPDDLGKQALESFITWLNGLENWTIIDWQESPVRGSDGNREFLLGAKNSA